MVSELGVKDTNLGLILKIANDSANIYAATKPERVEFSASVVSYACHFIAHLFLKQPRQT